MLRQVSRVFEIGERSPNLSHHHHTVAAKTDDPHGWIQKAKDNEWSTRELEAAIKEATTEPKTEWEEMNEDGDRVAKSIKRFFEHWTKPGIDGRKKQFVVGQAKNIRRICERVIQTEGKDWEDWGG